MFATTNNQIAATTTRRFSRALVLAAGLTLVTASVAVAETTEPAAPSQQEVAILRALLGVAPLTSPAATANVATDAATLAVPCLGNAPEEKKGATAASAEASGPTSDNSFVAATPNYHFARAVMAARVAASAQMQVVTR